MEPLPQGPGGRGLEPRTILTLGALFAALEGLGTLL
jgi:hypothetical protein